LSKLLRKNLTDGTDMIVNKVVVEQVPATILPSSGGGYQMKVNVDDQNKATIIT
jgi:hypothetical protein